MSLGKKIGLYITMMVQKKILRIAGITAILCLSFFAWDYYQRISWDNHIVSSPPAVFYVARKNALYNLAPSYYVNTEVLPEKYKRSLEIVKKGDAYFWSNNNNIVLKKTFEYRPRTKNGVIDEKGFHWVVFTSEDDSVKIKIQGNDYLRWNDFFAYDCYKNGFSGNAFILYDLTNDSSLMKLKHKNELTKKIFPAAPNKDLHLVVPLNVYVYENVFQNFYCN